MFHGFLSFSCGVTVLISVSYCSKNGRLSSGENSQGHDDNLWMHSRLMMMEVKNIYFLIAISHLVNLGNKSKYYYYCTIVKFQTAITRIDLEKKVSKYGIK